MSSGEGENGVPEKPLPLDSGNQNSPKSTLSQRSGDSIDLAIDGGIDTSIEQLYHNVCEMESSDDPSPSRRSFFSYGEESRIDSELCHLVGDIGIMETKKEVVIVNNGKDGVDQRKKRSQAESIQKQLFRLQSEFGASGKLPPRKRSSTDKSLRRVRPPNGPFHVRKPRKQLENMADGSPELLGPLLLKQTREMISSGENPKRALEFAIKATKSFEECSNDDPPNLEYVMSLHVLASIHCILGQYSEAIPVLEKSIEIPVIEYGQDHSLAKFAGCMQLGDTYAMLGQIENSILCYTAGLEIQKQVLGEMDPRVGETCRYVAEAHVQALQFEDAAKICQLALDIHREKGGPSSMEEAADRRLMGLICDARGDHEAALEHYVLVSMSMAANGQEMEVAAVDCSIGDAYLSLARYDEAICAYQKALASFKSSKGENNPSAASVFVRLADLYNKIGKYRDSKSYCENALRIYEKPNNHRIIAAEEIASGLIDIAAIYQSMDELDQAIKLLRKALKKVNNGDDVPSQQSTVAGIEAQIGVMHYMTGNFPESYKTFKSAITKMRASGEKKSAMFGIALNQMALSCVQLYAINEAAELFEEARTILEKEYGPYHPDTLAVYSNLAGTYDAMGRLDDAIEILEQVVRMREQKLGTANPEVVDEKRRLAELLKEAGRTRERESIALLAFLDHQVVESKSRTQVIELVV
ncbi:Protein KINESIN LIGHT CHAIN-RELATED 2 [Linum perenne]